MNWRHFTAFVWLRWRLLRNHWRRAGALNSLLMLVVTLVAGPARTLSKDGKL